MKRRCFTTTSVALLAIGLGACDSPTPAGLDSNRESEQADRLIVPIGTSTGTSNLCGDIPDPTGVLGGLQRQSPCDGAHNGAGVTFTGDTYFLSPLVGSPNPIPPNFSGLASRLKVRAYPYPDQAYCEGLQGANPNQCAIRDGLPAVAEDVTGGRYETTWKTVKKGNGDKVPNDSYWQLVLMLDFDGNGWEDDEDIASRIIKWTDTPSTDNPADGWSLDINRGSNQPIKMVLADNGDGCFGTAQAPNEVECLVDFGAGGRLAVETGLDDGIVLDIGAGNGGIGVRTVSGEVCGLSGGQSNLDVDVPVLGTCVTWQVDPPLAGQILTGTAIFVCEDLGGTLNLGDYFVHMQDAQGTQALPPVSATAECAASGFMASAPSGLDYLFNKLAGLFGARDLLAGAGALGHGSPGGGLRTIGSDFQLALSSSMGALSAQSTTLPENGSTTIELGLANHDGFASPGVGVTIYSDLTSSVACIDPGCVPITTGLPTTAGSGVVTPSDANGLARATWTVTDQTASAWALGCGIAVPGSDTPANGGFAGDGGPCDRDPTDADGTGDINVPSNYPDGFANGLLVSLTDPFNTPSGASQPVWVNDLPIEFTASVCSAPTVDGIRSATDPWSQAGAPSTCIPAGFGDSFEVSLGGNLGGGGTATIEWFIGSDGADQRVYFGLEVPVTKDPSKVKLALEFDAGDGTSPGVADEFDDQLELVRDKFSANQVSGDVFDRYLTASCANNSSLSVCNALDTNVGGTASAEGAVQFDAANSVLFFELSQKLSGDVPYDLNGLGSGHLLGFVLQLGVGNVRQSGTVWPDQSGSGQAYQSFTIP